MLHVGTRRTKARKNQDSCTADLRMFQTKTDIKQYFVVQRDFAVARLS